MAEMESNSHLSEEQLAENAGFRVASIIEKIHDFESVAVLCGPGNNGADGMIAAFYLASEFGIDADVILAADPEELRPIGKKAYRRLAETDVSIFVAGTKKCERQLESLDACPLVLDCLLGTGQKGPPRGDVATVLDAVGEHDRVVAIDVPTGIDSDTGEALGAHAEPFLSLVLGFPKPYLFTNDGRRFADNWMLVPIGLAASGDFDAPEMIDPTIAELLPFRHAFSHKRSSVLLSVAGSRQYPGAATLCAMGAVRMGTGMVVAAGCEEGLASLRSIIYEAPLAILPSEGGEISPAADLSPHFEAATAVVVGPGLGRGAGAARAVEQVSKSGKPTVFDGDALWHLASGAERPKPFSSVLTPHAGEAARLLNVEVAEIDNDRFGSAMALSEAFSQTVVLKGLHPVIASAARQEINVSPTGTPLLASAGTGDVLAGMIGSLLAQGMDPNSACCLGTYVHGALAEIVSARFGRRTYGVVASDLAGEIPVALALMQEMRFYPKCLDLLAPIAEEKDEDEA